MKLESDFYQEEKFFKACDLILTQIKNGIDQGGLKMAPTHSDLIKVFYEDPKLLAFYPEAEVFEKALELLAKDKMITLGDIVRSDGFLITLNGKLLLASGGYLKKYQLEQKKKNLENFDKSTSILRNIGTILMVLISIVTLICTDSRINQLEEKIQTKDSIQNIVKKIILNEINVFRQSDSLALKPLLKDSIKPFNK